MFQIYLNQKPITVIRTGFICIQEQLRQCCNFLNNISYSFNANNVLQLLLHYRYGWWIKIRWGSVSLVLVLSFPFSALARRLSAVSACINLLQLLHKVLCGDLAEP